MTTHAVTQNSSYFSNNTQDPNYFWICINKPIRIHLWISYSAFCFLLGFPATLKVLQKLYDRRRQNISNDFFMFNLTIIDLAFLCFLPLNATYYLVWHNATIENVCTYIYLFALSGRPLFMACICGEYYFAVLHPITYKTNKRTAIMRKTVAVIIWFFTIGLGYTIASNPMLYSTAFASLPQFIALPVIGLCDVSVFRALRKKDPSGKTTVHPQKKRALRIIISSFIVTFTAYLPPAVIFTMGHDMKLSKTEMYHCVLSFLAVCSSISGCVIMPVLYLESIGQLNVWKRVFSCVHKK